MVREHTQQEAPFALLQDHPAVRMDTMKLMDVAWVASVLPAPAPHHIHVESIPVVASPNDR